jgi:hypothetical protein
VRARLQVPAQAGAAAQLLTMLARCPAAPPCPRVQVIVEMLDCSLVVFSPYNSLMHLLRSSPQIKELSQNAWACLNDVYRTDLPLRYPPHMLAIGCLHLVSVMCNRDIRTWLQSLQVDVNQVRGSGPGVGPPPCRLAPRAPSCCPTIAGPAPTRTLPPTPPQVYDIVSEMVDMYGRYKDAISADEAARLLGVLQQGAAGQQAQQQQQGGAAAGPS